MGIFNKNKKNNKDNVGEESNISAVESKTQEDSVPTVKVDLTDGEAVSKRLRELYEMDSLYIALSPGIADLQRGLSLPLILMPKEEEKVILVFSNYDKAKKYVTEKRPMVIDGVIPVAEMKRDNKINNIDVVCANALAQGITAIDFDVDDENGFGCKLPYFMQVNKMSGQGQIVFTNEEAEKIKANGGKFTPRFNAMHIVDFTNPYELLKDRAEQVLDKILGEEGLEWAEENCKLHELCYSANQLMFKAVQAEKDNNDEENARLKALVEGINELIFNSLSQLKVWYTLENKESGEIYTKNGAAYILYTPRYGNRMPQGTVLKPVHPSVAEFAYLVGNKPVNMVVVTDGPNIMHLIDRSVFGF